MAVLSVLSLRLTNFSNLIHMFLARLLENSLVRGTLAGGGIRASMNGPVRPLRAPHRPGLPPCPSHMSCWPTLPRMYHISFFQFEMCFNSGTAFVHCGCQIQSLNGTVPPTPSLYLFSLCVNASRHEDVRKGNCFSAGA